MSRADGDMRDRAARDRAMRRGGLILSVILGLGVAAAAVLLLVEQWGDVSPLEAVLSILIGGAVFLLTSLASWLLFSLATRLLFRRGKTRGGEDEPSQSP